MKGFKKRFKIRSNHPFLQKGLIVDLIDNHYWVIKPGTEETNEEIVLIDFYGTWKDGPEEHPEYFEVVGKKIKKCKHPHCRCMNLGGNCPNKHYSDCIKD